MRLFKPVWQTDKRGKLDKALEAVRKIRDPRELRDAALYAYLPEVQSAAIMRIKDPRVLSEVILANTTAYEIRREAVRMIKDPEVLTEIAMQRQAYPADGDAIAMLSDQDHLRRIALSEQGGEQDKAVYKIIDQQILAEIAVDAKKGSARKTAIRNITDPEILLHILNNAEEVYTRNEVFDRLEQLRKSSLLQELNEEQHLKFLEIVIQEKDRNVRIRLDGFQSTADLNRIYREAARYDLRAKALSILVLDESFPDSGLLEAWKTADSCQKTVHNTFSNPWRDALQNVERRIAAAAGEAPELLLDFIRDPSVNSKYAADCLHYLFELRDQEDKQIQYLHDEAFAAYLRNISHYMKEEKKDTAKDYILLLARAIPHEYHDEYGLSVFVEENAQ